jgi:hypothetical protein
MKTATIDQALRTQRAMRDELGLGEEDFPLPAFIGMLSDEIEQLRDAGHDGGAIAALVSRTSGIEVTPDEIVEHYAEHDERAKG